MVLARVAEFISGTSQASSDLDSSVSRLKQDVDAATSSISKSAAVRLQTPTEEVSSSSMAQARDIWDDAQVVPEDTEDEGRPPYLHAMLAGGLGGLTGDMVMHSLDTVKTRQQGDPSRPPKYTKLLPSYYTILRQEGVRRGLYSGVSSAAVGSFGGTSIFFLTYEWSKRWMIDSGYVPPSIAYFTAGWFADLAASPIYVPTEVLKTRLQLQGRYKNPHFYSGYNYKSTWDAARTIVRREGWEALFHGYGATLWRDLPFSAMQFAFYEKEREAAKYWVGSKDIGLPLEIFVAMTAGGMAGALSCPMDVVKTRIQTQINPVDPHKEARRANAGTGACIPRPPAWTSSPSPSSQPVSSTTPSPVPSTAAASMTASATATAKQQHRSMFTNAPAPPPPPANAKSAVLDTSSVITGLRIIYKTEGLGGWFRGVGPRTVWTSIQTGTMLVLYQALLKYFDEHPFASSSSDD